MLSPHGPGFATVNNLLKRLNAGDVAPHELVSTESDEVPEWQRYNVWSDLEKGLLIYSIIQGYPIGTVILWKKPNGVRVPIDGRQRLTAIYEFSRGRVAIPDSPFVPAEFQRAKYKLLAGDEGRGVHRLELKDREAFEEYEPSIIQYDNLDEKTAMDMFVRLQGGKSLTKAEIRAALGGKVCAFVTQLTSGVSATDPDSEEEAEEEEDASRHAFFKELNLRNIRKAHRGLCDVLLHEFLNPGKNKHWSSLQKMYTDGYSALSEKSKKGFLRSLGRFEKAVEVRENGKTRVLPQLRKVFLILTYYRAWREIDDQYARDRNFSFREIVSGFETDRAAGAKLQPWVRFNAALSNAGYAEERITERHTILMSYILRRFPELRLKDPARAFSEDQKIAIWDRAGHQCEWVDRAGRCGAKFADFREADADHIVKWAEGGPTSLDNGRLLCQQHNRAPRP